MKILTKKWAQMHEVVRVVHFLKEFDEQKITYKEVNSMSKSDFCDDIAKNIELAKVCLKTNIVKKLYKAKIERDRKILLSLPKEVYNKIKDIKSVVLGYANSADKKLLTSFANQILNVIEKKADEANILTKKAEDYLLEEFILDEVVGELVYEEYTNGKNYYISIGSRDICIKDFKIIERENFKINKWDTNNPLTLCTALDAAELHYISDKCFELHLLLVNGDKYKNEKYWYFTIQGTDIAFVEFYLDYFK